jgi:hypothetical protein
MLAMVLPVTGVAGAESKPMIRDIEVSYLLNCNFRANRPYMWRKKVLLTPIAPWANLFNKDELPALTFRTGK